MEKVDIDPLWHLADVLSLQDAAALIAGYDPQQVEDSRNENVLGDIFTNLYPRLIPVEKALRNAVLSGLLKAEIVRTGVRTSKAFRQALQIYEDNAGHWRPVDEINMSGTRVKVDDLCKWLKDRGFKTRLFFTQADDTPDFLDPCHKNYSPKLAAAVKAWQAVNTDPKLITGKTVKQALLKWLRKNADQFGLTKDDGNPNEQGIEEIAKIANWDAKGGAPKTPG